MAAIHGGHGLQLLLAPHSRHHSEMETFSSDFLNIVRRRFF
jgi:hypothetical protein